MGWKQHIEDHRGSSGECHFPTFTPGGHIGGRIADTRRSREIPIRWVWQGDQDKASAHVRHALALMAQLENHMGFMNLRQGVLRRLVAPDVFIECDKRFGLRTIIITVNARGAGEEHGEQPEILRLLAAVSNSTGIHLYGAKHLKADFKYETPLYGYYEALPDRYQFSSAYRGSWNTWAFPASNALAQSRAVDASLDGDGMDRLITKIYQEEDADLVLWSWAGLSAYNVNTDPCGCKWCRPTLMPWNGKTIVASFVTRYGGENMDADDLPAGYQYYDALLLSDIGLGRYDRAEEHARNVAWKRGNSAGSYGDVGPVVPLPVHNNVRRFVVPRWGGESFRGSAVDPTLFRIASIRNENDVRDLAFPARMLAEQLPEWLRGCLRQNSPNNKYFQVLGEWAQADENTGETIVHVVLFFGGNGYDFEDSEGQRRWGMCLCRFIVPAAVFDMTPEEEETALLDGTRIENVVTADQFLPLLDMLVWKNRARLYKGGSMGLNYHLEYGDDDSLVTSSPVVLYAMPDDMTWNPHVNYTIGDVDYTYPSGYEYNINDNTMRILWNHAFQLCMLLFARGEIDDQKALFQRGDTAYSWTRHFGGVALTPEGMFPQDMIWPDIITDDVRARPNVTYAGDGLWCCVCERMGERVLSVHVGTPFSTDTVPGWWVEIKLVSDEWAERDGNRIVHVRPLLATAARVVLLAIVREIDDEEQPHYRLAVCDGPPTDPNNPHARPMLRFRGEIPLEQEEEGMSWDICVLDIDHEYARFMLRYPNPPIADVACSYNKMNAVYRVPFGESAY